MVNQLDVLDIANKSVNWHGFDGQVFDHRILFLSNNFVKQLLFKFEIQSEEVLIDREDIHVDLSHRNTSVDEILVFGQLP